MGKHSVRCGLVFIASHRPKPKPNRDLPFHQSFPEWQSERAAQSCRLHAWWSPLTPLLPFQLPHVVSVHDADLELALCWPNSMSHILVAFASPSRMACALVVTCRVVTKPPNSLWSCSLQEAYIEQGILCRHSACIFNLVAVHFVL